jgi:hypothetical protein
MEPLNPGALNASLQRAANVLGQEGRKPVEDTPAPTVKGLRAGGRQRHR